MNELSLFNFGPQQVRELEKGGEPWFVAKDVIQILGVGNITEALRGLREDERCSVVLNTPGGKQEMAMVSEPGLYRLVFRSRKPEAEKFKRWVTHEVLPSIRKHGVYVLENRVAELSEKLEVRTDMYFDAVADLQKEREHYRLSHTPLKPFEIEAILVCRKAGLNAHATAERSGRSVRTVRRIWARSIDEVTA